MQYFCQGAATGLAVSALNHVAHRSNDLGKCPTCPKKAKVGDTYVDSNGGDWMYFENIGWSPYVTAETLALGSGGMIEWLGGGPVKGAQWLTKMLKSPNASLQGVKKIGNYWEYFVKKLGNNGSFTIYKRYFNDSGKTVKLFHDTYDKTYRFLHREFMSGQERMKIWWDGTRQWFSKLK